MLKFSSLPTTVTQADIFEPWMLIKATKSGGVRNMNFQQLHLIFESGLLDLQDVPLFMYGKLDNGKFGGWIVRIWSGTYNVLEGRHYVGVVGKEPELVSSLHHWRRHGFGIVDKLSFERAAFAIFRETQTLVRLKNFRTYCTLPGCITHTSSSLSKRTKQQLVNEITRLFHAYARDRMDRTTSEIMGELELDVHSTLQNLSECVVTRTDIELFNSFGPSNEVSTIKQNAADPQRESTALGAQYQELLAVSFTTSYWTPKYLPGTNPFT